MITAIVIDDERKARETLSHLLTNFCKDVDVKGHFESVADAETYLQSNTVDLVFLDIELPEKTGLYLLEKLKDSNVKVIMVTGYDHYAIKSIKLNAFDYILKPVDLSELQAAVDRFEKSKKDIKADNSQWSSSLFVSTVNGTYIIKFSDVIHIVAEGSYSTIFTTDNKYMTSRNLSELSKELDKSIFLRVHNSHIINVNRVVSFNKSDGLSVIMDNDNEISVSRRKKEELIESLKQLKITPVVRD